MEYLIPIWDHQRLAIDRAKDLPYFALFFSMGTGKTCTTINILRHKINAEKRHLRVLIFCPPLVIKNWRDEFGMHSKIKNVTLLVGQGAKRLKTFKEKAYQGIWPIPQIFVTNYESLLMPELYKAFTEWKSEALVFDECFGGEVLINTPQGEKAISSLSPGDLIYSAIGLAKIRRIFSKKISCIVLITFNGRTIRVSENHLFFTSLGWIKAKELKEGDFLGTPNTCLSLLRKELPKRYLPVHSASLSKLFQELWNELEGEDQGVSGLYSQTKPDVFEEKSRESFSNSSKNGAWSKGERGEWFWADSKRSNIVESFRAHVAKFISNFVREKEKGLPHLLQSRLGLSTNKIGNRSRRSFPFSSDSKATGYKKRKEAHFIRVDNIKIQEQRSERESEGDLFFDLEICGHPSFTVNGALVHNSHRLKNYSAKRSKLAARLANPKEQKRPLAYILSGTPVLNSPMDLFHQYLILDNGVTFGKNFFIFRAKYFIDKNAGMPRDRYFPDWVIRPGALEEINQKIFYHGMRVTKEECLSLPEEITVTIKCALTLHQKRNYSELKKDLVTYIQGETVIASLAIVKALRLMQIASGYLPLPTDAEGNTPKAVYENTDKDEKLKELLEELTPHSKVLVWAVFKQNYASIRKVCDELKIKYVEVHGEISRAKQDENIQAFKEDPEIKVFLSHPGSGGIGVNLTCAPYSIFYSRTFSLEHYLQARARNHRGGQESKVTHYDLICENTIEQSIQNMLANKEELGEKLLSRLASELIGEDRGVEWGQLR